jgi:hypothetical protein
VTHVILPFPKPEVRGEGTVLYRCAECGDLMPPEAAVIVADKSYHPDHAPEEPDGR